MLSQIERLRIVPDRRHELAGISGGLVMDLETGLVIAVEGPRGAAHGDEAAVLAANAGRATRVTADLR